MDVPPEIAFRGVEPTDTLKERILDGIDDLEEVHDRLVSCRVMVEDTTPGRSSGKIYRVRLDIGVPNRTVVVDFKPDGGNEIRDVYQAVKQAFDIGRRRLDQIRERDRDRSHGRDLPPHGRVIKLLTTDTGTQYGFLLSGDGREIYFHENAVADADYEDLEVGTEVRFTERRGDEGPQASAVTPLDSAEVGPRQESSVPLRSPESGD